MGRIRRSVKLPVNYAFSLRHDGAANDVMERALSEVDIVRPLVPVVANVTAAPADNPDDIKALLVRQVTAMVRWRECVLMMPMRESGVDTLIEVGAGKVLSGLTKRIDRDIKILNAETPSDIEAVLQKL